MSKEKLKSKLESYIKDYEKRLELWKAVSFKTKKDGTPFKKLSMAIDGAKFNCYYPVEDELHPYLTVDTYNNGVYTIDHLQAFWYLDELPEVDERRKDYQHTFIRQTTPQTLDELKLSIERHIQKLERYITITKEEVELIDKLYDKYLEVATNLKNELNKELYQTEYTTLYYAIKDDIKELF